MHLEFGRRYVAKRLLGKGGMGVTYKGVDLYKNRDVAIKQMRPEFRNSQKLRSRFVREIREHQKLDHPHIVKVLDCNLRDDNPYAIYEFCEKGGVLKHPDGRLSGQPVPVTGVSPRQPPAVVPDVIRTQAQREENRRRYRSERWAHSPFGS